MKSGGVLKVLSFTRWSRQRAEESHYTHGPGGTAAAGKRAKKHKLSHPCNPQQGIPCVIFLQKSIQFSMKKSRQRPEESHYTHGPWGTSATGKRAKNHKKKALKKESPVWFFSKQLRTKEPCPLLLCSMYVFFPYATGWRQKKNTSYHKQSHVSLGKQKEKKRKFVKTTFSTLCVPI